MLLFLVPGGSRFAVFYKFVFVCCRIKTCWTRCPCHWSFLEQNTISFRCVHTSLPYMRGCPTAVHQCSTKAQPLPFYQLVTLTECRIAAAAWRSFAPTHRAAVPHPWRRRGRIALTALLLPMRDLSWGQDIAPEHRKLICKTLRFVAHMNGASLHFTSDKDEALVKTCKALMNNLAFRSGGLRSSNMDHDKPLLVAAGNDFLEKIGAPTMAADSGKVSARYAHHFAVCARTHITENGAIVYPCSNRTAPWQPYSPPEGL